MIISFWVYNYDANEGKNHPTLKLARKDARERNVAWITKYFVLPNGVTSHWKHIKTDKDNR